MISTSSGSVGARRISAVSLGNGSALSPWKDRVQSILSPEELRVGSEDPAGEGEGEGVVGEVNVDVDVDGSRTESDASRGLSESPVWEMF